MEGSSKQHSEISEQTKRYTFMSTDNQLHTGHAGGTSISSCQNSGAYTDTLTYKKSVSNGVNTNDLVESQEDKYSPRLLAYEIAENLKHNI